MTNPASTSPRPAASHTAKSWTTAWWLVAGILVAFYVLLVASVREKSLTADEIAHSTAGYSYWRYNDYRFNPENGNLPQRLIGLPLVLSDDIRYPSTDSDDWRTSKIWRFGYEWYHGIGNDVTAMLQRGRAAVAVITVTLAFVVWRWSRRLFGPRGALVSLLLTVLCPTILANGALMTSDAAASLFFLSAVWALWSLLHGVTLARLAASLVLVSALFISKASALLILPIALTLAVARLARGEPLPWQLGRASAIAGRGRQAGCFAALGLLHVVAVWAVIWTSVGFRFSPYADGDPRNRPAQSWEAVLAKPDPLTLLERLSLGPDQTARAAAILNQTRYPKEAWAPERVALMEQIRSEVLTPPQRAQLDRLLAEPPAAFSSRLIASLRRHRVLPESFLYGMAHASKHARLRNAFLNGEVRLDGWRWFFPYTFLVKTPLTTLVILVLALAASVFAVRRGGRGYETLPLWTLLVFYWIAAISSPLNIGHRHIMATYPPMFVLCGIAATWWATSPRRVGVALSAALALLAVEVLARFPNYIPFFNSLAGGPAHAYRHLVDSSLDWGQDLSSVRPYLERHGITGPIYLSSFGDANPDTYGIKARHLYSFAGLHVTPPMQLRPFPAATANAEAAEELRRHPDYEIAGSSRGPNNTVGVLFLKRPEALRLGSGTYIIGASMLQPVMYSLDGPLGPWNPRFEATYQRLYAEAKPLLSDNTAERLAALRQHRASEWEDLLQRFETYRFARLTAYLRKREPADTINGAMLVYRLSDADLLAALDGPPPEVGTDVPAKYAAGSSAPSLPPR